MVKQKMEEYESQEEKNRNMEESINMGKKDTSKGIEAVNKEDYIVRATAANAQIRAFAITSKNMVEEMRRRHGSSPIVTAGLGRLMSAAAMMGTMMKGEKDLLTIQIQCDGPIGGMTVTADAKGHVKGYANVTDIVLPANEKGKLDVGGAVGNGVMSVVKDMGMKNPYVGQVALQTGEIADDLTYYFATSEQTPSSVGLGVLLNHENTVEQAGGFLIQLMPDTEESVIAKLEEKLSGFTSVTSYLSEGHTPEMLLEMLLSDLDLEITERLPVAFCCDCSKEKITKALYSLGKEELDRMIQENEPIDVHCHFCNTDYHFDVEELKEIRK